jgi:predicted transcriptional regulator
MVMSDINVKLKHNLEDANTLFKILFASIKIGEPASKRKIADVADISSQLVDYHIDKLVKSGQLVIIDSKYMAQKAFLDKNIYKYLKDKVITQDLVDNVAHKLDFTQAEVQEHEVLEESIITLLKLFTIELKEK